MFEGSFGTVPIDGAEKEGKKGAWRDFLGKVLFGF